MPSDDLLIPFFIASAIFACVPGPGMLYAAAQTVAGGSRAGWLSALGFHVGGYFHIAAAAFGLAVLLKAVPALYLAVKLAGAAYLVFLGVRLIVQPQPAAGHVIPNTRVSSGRIVRDSILVEILNPKTALFYLAFLPQFTDLSAGLPIWAQVLVLGAVVNVMFSATDAACVLLSDRVTRLLSASQRMNRMARRLGGTILIGLGINLAVSRQ